MSNDAMRAAKWKKRALAAAKKVRVLMAEVDKLSRWKKKLPKVKRMMHNKDAMVERIKPLQREVVLWKGQTLRLRDEVDDLKKKVRNARIALS